MKSYLSNYLADVEIQLIMQGLNIAELLAFARCSKFMRRTASQPFPWKYTPPLNLVDYHSSNFTTRSKFFHNLHQQGKNSIPLQHAYLSVEYDVKKANQHFNMANVNTLLKTVMECNFHDKLIKMEFVCCELYTTNLAKCIKQNKNIKFLCFKMNLMHHMGISLLIDGIKHMNELLEITFEFNLLGCENTTALIDALRHQKKLHTVHLGNNAISSNGMLVLSNMIKYSNTIKDVNICCNRIIDEDMVALSDAIKCSTSITSLNIGNNNYISNYGLAILFNGIKYNKTLTSLHLGGLNYHYTKDDGSDEHFFSMMDSIKLNPSIKKLYFNKSSISNNGFMKIMDTIESNCNITSLDLQNTHFNHITCIKKLAYVIKNNKSSITDINLSSNNLSRESIIVLADAIKYNTSIVTLDLSNNNIKYEDSEELLDAIMYNKYIKNINLRKNEIDEQYLCKITKSVNVTSRKNIQITSTCSFWNLIYFAFYVIKSFCCNR